MKTLIENPKRYFMCLMIFFVLIFITFYYLFKGNNISDIIVIIKKANSLYIILGLILMFTFISCEALNIKILLKSLNHKISFLKSLKYAFVGFYFSSITPSSSGGQPVQLLYMKKDKIDIGISSLSLLIITVVYQTATLFIGLSMFILKLKFIINNIRGIEFLIIYGVLIYCVLIIMFAVIIFSEKLSEKIVNGVINILTKLRIIKSKEKIIQKAKIQLNEYRNGANYIRKNPSVLIKVLFITIIQVLAMFSVTFCVYKALGQSKLSFFDITAIQAIVSIAVSNIPLPGAVGASENVFMLIYKTMFGKNLIFPAMLLSRVISYYSFIIVSGIISMIAYFMMFNMKKSIEIT